MNPCPARGTRCSVGVVEGAGAARARVGEREALAPPDVVQRVHGVPGAAVGLHRHEVHRIHALGRTEEDAAAEAPPPLGRVRRQRAEALGRGEVVGVRGLVGLPLQDPVGEGELVEGAAEARGDVGLERGAVEAPGLVGLDLEHRAALHELALDAKRCQLVVAVDRCSHSSTIPKSWPRGQYRAAAIRSSASAL